MTKLLKAVPRLDSNENAAQALKLVAKFGWLRASELGRMLYPKNLHARKYAENHLRKLLELRYVVDRQLPGRGAGKAYVLSQRGANYLNSCAAEEVFQPGTRWGISGGGRWEPPSSWRHDLLAISLLSIFVEADWSVLSELEIRKLNVIETDKIPDGIAFNDKHCLWLEVENQRKTGENLEHMIRTVGSVLRGKSIKFPGVPAFTTAFIAYPREVKDERGFSINHHTRITNKIKTIPVASPITFYFLEMTMRGLGVASVQTSSFTHAN